MTFNEKLKELRLTKGLSMEQLGNELNMSSGLISDIENGKKNNPKLKTLIKLADYFDISIDELVGRERKFETKG